MLQSTKTSWKSAQYLNHSRTIKIVSKDSIRFYKGLKMQSYKQFGSLEKTYIAKKMVVVMEDFIHCH